MICDVGTRREHLMLDKQVYYKLVITAGPRLCLVVST